MARSQVLTLAVAAACALAVVVGMANVPATSASTPAPPVLPIVRRARAERAMELSLARGGARARAPRASDPVYPKPRFFEQYQDHFDGTNTNTWQQAYYVNATFWKPGSDAPVFLCVGGEGPPLDGSVVVSSVHCNNAVEWLEETGALMLALEHRFYGCHNMSACPVSKFHDPPVAEDLHFLSSRQALGDIARFIDFARTEFNLSVQENRIVTWGGSYPGMLAGWARLKFPHLVHASVASSAPVRAEVDMYQYQDVTAFAYTVSEQGVGGSDACLSAIAGGHATIKQMFNTTDGRAALAKQFGQTPDWYADVSNQASFAGNGVAYFPSQGNDPACTTPACNIAKICVIMTDATKGDAVARLAAVRSAQLTWVPAEFTHVVDTTAPVPAPHDAQPDYWGYQTCTEFAFFQTCEVGSKCPYAQGYVLLDGYYDMCTSEFNIAATTVARNVQYSNDYYGADTPAGSCVIYPNGNVDPWSSLSVLKSPSPGIPVLMVDGASHHAWTHPSAPTDQASVVAARAALRQQVSTWLQQDCLQAEPSK